MRLSVRANACIRICLFSFTAVLIKVVKPKKVTCKIQLIRLREKLILLCTELAAS